MAKKVIPNMEGKSRPETLADRLGYPESYCDRNWENNLKKHYQQVEGGWARK